MKPRPTKSQIKAAHRFADCWSDAISDYKPDRSTDDPFYDLGITRLMLSDGTLLVVLTQYDDSDGEGHTEEKSNTDNWLGTCRFGRRGEDVPLARAIPGNLGRALQ